VQNIDPTNSGNVARYINHSCLPNLSMFTVRVDSFVPTVAFFASKDIAADEEIMYDYGEKNSDGERVASEDRVKCLCGAGDGICVGFLPFDPQL